MQIVATIILWSIAWLWSVGMQGQHAPLGKLEAVCQRTESSIASAVAPKPVYSAIPEVPKLADLGATQTEDDDLSEADALDSSPFPRWGDSGHTDAVNHFPTPCDRADSAGRLFSIRC